MVLSFNPSTGQLLQSLALTAMRSSRQLLLVLLFQNVPRVGGGIFNLGQKLVIQLLCLQGLKLGP